MGRRRKTSSELAIEETMRVCKITPEKKDNDSVPLWPPAKTEKFSGYSEGLVEDALKFFDPDLNPPYRDDTTGLVPTPLPTLDAFAAHVRTSTLEIRKLMADHEDLKIAIENGLTVLSRNWIEQASKNLIAASVAAKGLESLASWKGDEGERFIQNIIIVPPTPTPVEIEHNFPLVGSNKKMLEDKTNG